MNEITLRVSKNLYSSSVMLKAAYTFLDKIYIHVEDLDMIWIVHMKAKNENTDITVFKDKFENELIFQSVRRNVYQQTNKIRELLMARAMASTIIDEEKNIDISCEEKVDENLDDILKSWFDTHEE